VQGSASSISANSVYWHFNGQYRLLMNSNGNLALGMNFAVGDWVLAEACRQMSIWHHNKIRVPKVSVNLSARQFRRNDLLASVQLVLDETGLPSRLLELEITEGE
jgi:EAL domain-containing protein (putative c-di-GMP-specific phosphodiesterase class I)